MRAVQWRGGSDREEHYVVCRNTGSNSGMKVCLPVGKTQACSEQQPVFVHQQPAEVSWTLELCRLQLSQTIWTWKYKPSELHLATTALEGALMLRAAAIKQEPFSVCHNRRRTPWSDHTAVGRRSNTAQWVQPGTARVYAHYHVTATLRLNGFPPVLQKLAHGECIAQWLYIASRM